MAFSGFHVAFGYASGSMGGAARDTDAGLLSDITSAETMSVAGTSTITAPDKSRGGARPMAVLYASSDSWYTVGSSPADPTSTSAPRDMVMAGERREIFVDPGDKVRWALA